MAGTNKRLTWDENEKRQYEYGVSNGVLYVMDESGKYPNGEPWNGLTNVSDNPTGGENNSLWADGIEYANFRSAEKYACSIEAYMYPDGFSECDGSASPIPGMYIRQQTRKKFGMSWRTEIGNANNPEQGYKIHIAYGLTASPSERSSDTVNENFDAASFSWEADGTAVPITGYKPSAKLEFSSIILGQKKMKALEDLLYGCETAAAHLPLPDEIISAIKAVT